MLLRKDSPYYFMHTKKSRLSTHVLRSTSVSMLLIVCAFDTTFSWRYKACFADVVFLNHILL